MIVLCIMGLMAQKYKVPASIFDFTLYCGLKTVTSFTVALLPVPEFFHTAVAKPEDETSMVVWNLGFFWDLELDHVSISQQTLSFSAQM